nr:hypothetical protein [Tanacetum cinerariifolium]
MLNVIKLGSTRKAKLTKKNFKKPDPWMLLEYSRHSYKCSSISDTISIIMKHMKSLQASIQERAKHKREYDRRMNDGMMQSKEGNVDSSKALNDGLVITESSGTESDKQDTSSTSGNDTDALDADIRLKSNKEPRVEVQLTSEHNAHVLALKYDDKHRITFVYK